MIVSVARASMDDADTTPMFGIWSDIIVGDRPAGLVDCLLLRGDGAVHVHAIRESQAAMIMPWKSDRSILRSGSSRLVASTRAIPSTR